jgi:hypothetical protein
MPNARKNPYLVLDFYVQDWHWMGSIFNSYPCDLVSLFAAFDHSLLVYHCGVSAVDQSSRRAHVTQFTKFSSQIAEQNRVLLSPYFDWESYF